MPGRASRHDRGAADLAVALTAGEAARAAAENAARRSYGRLVALLSARTRDVAAAEDALAEAFAIAVSRWPLAGVPDNPEGWLLAAARRRAIDAARRRGTAAAATDHLIMMSEELDAARGEGDDIPDRRLALMFACAHPAIEEGVRAPLILQTVLGFDAATIASAFLISPASMAQRLVRAKSRIREAGIPFHIPDRDELPMRIGGVLNAIYAAFAEGWSDPQGADARRRNLSDEGIWLGRLVADLMPEQAEAQGLLALMLYAEARRPARRNAAGDYVPLAAQDAGLWDDAMIDEAESLLRGASALGGMGRFQLEAAIQSVHAAKRHGGHVDWPALRTFYDALVVHTGSPVAAINRAVAIAEIEGAAAGLDALDAIAGDRRVVDYQPYWAARAELLARAQDPVAAAQAYQLAIGLERDEAIRRFLEGKRAALTH